PTTTFLPCTVSCSANHALVWRGWWFIVIMQNRWSSYSVIVLPGQCLYTSPTSKSSKYRPNGRSYTVIGLRRYRDQVSTGRFGRLRARGCPCKESARDHQPLDLVGALA